MPKWSAFRKFFLLHLHGKNVNPLSSTTHWRKSHCLNEKRMLLSESFSHWSIWTGKGQLAENFEHFSVPTFHQRREGQVVRFSGNFYPSANKPKKRIPSLNSKIPMPFLAQRCRSGHKKSTAGKFLRWLLCRGCSVVHFQFITEGSSLSSRLLRL